MKNIILRIVDLNPEVASVCYGLFTIERNWSEFTQSCKLWLSQEVHLLHHLRDEATELTHL